MVVINLTSLCYFHAVMALYQTSVRLQTPYAQPKQDLAHANIAAQRISLMGVCMDRSRRSSYPPLLVVLDDVQSFNRLYCCFNDS